jgi:hypothetical protein
MSLTIDSKLPQHLTASSNFAPLLNGQSSPSHIQQTQTIGTLQTIPRPLQIWPGFNQRPGVAIENTTNPNSLLTEVLNLTKSLIEKLGTLMQQLNNKASIDPNGLNSENQSALQPSAFETTAPQAAAASLINSNASSAPVNASSNCNCPGLSPESERLPDESKKFLSDLYSFAEKLLLGFTLGKGLFGSVLKAGKSILKAVKKFF